MLELRELLDWIEPYRDVLSQPVQSFQLKGLDFDFASHRYLMGVVNLSRDSWYRESVCLDAISAIQRATTLAAQGAHIVDIGAESTLPNAERVSDDAQLAQLLPIVRELSHRNIRTSVETYSARVAAGCLQAGTAVINLTGTAQNQAIYQSVAAHDAAVILCYVQGSHVRNVQDIQFSSDPIDIMAEYFQREIAAAKTEGVTRIFIDPGLGFYYRNLQDSTDRIRHQMQTFLHTFRLRRLGWPVCHALPHAFELFREEVRSAEPFFAVLASLGGTNLLRTHEIPRTKAVLDTLGAWQSPSKR
ncbi:MAG: dihydropteroate synthase [Limisphaerales bacterium]|jgi:dihydropteroate synthase